MDAFGDVLADDLCVARPAGSGGGLDVRVGVPLADVYLEFLAGRCRPNTVGAAAYDLKVFFTVVGKPPGEVVPGDVLAFITAQRTGRVEGHAVLQPVAGGGEPAGVSAATVRRRLSIVSGFFAFLQARGDVAANPVPRGLATRRERSRPGPYRRVPVAARNGGYLRVQEDVSRPGIDTVMGASDCMNIRAWLVPAMRAHAATSDVRDQPSASTDRGFRLSAAPVRQSHGG